MKIIIRHRRLITSFHVSSSSLENWTHKSAKNRRSSVSQWSSMKLVGAIVDNVEMKTINFISNSGNSNLFLASKCSTVTPLIIVPALPSGKIIRFSQTWSGMTEKRKNLRSQRISSKASGCCFTESNKFLVVLIPLATRFHSRLVELLYNSSVVANELLLQ